MLTLCSIMSCDLTFDQRLNVISMAACSAVAATVEHAYKVTGIKSHDHERESVSPVTEAESSPGPRIMCLLTIKILQITIMPRR